MGFVGGRADVGNGGKRGEEVGWVGMTVRGLWVEELISLIKEDVENGRKREEIRWVGWR